MDQELVLMLHFLCPIELFERLPLPIAMAGKHHSLFQLAPSLHLAQPEKRISVPTLPAPCPQANGEAHHPHAVHKKIIHPDGVVDRHRRQRFMGEVSVTVLCMDHHAR